MTHHVSVLQQRQIVNKSEMNEWCCSSAVSLSLTHLTQNDILAAEREKLLFHHERIIFARAPGQMNGRRRKQGIYSV
jgi:hypothetical protein